MEYLLRLSQCLQNLNFKNTSRYTIPYKKYYAQLKFSSWLLLAERWRCSRTAYNFLIKQTNSIFIRTFIFRLRFFYYLVTTKYLSWF